eukprot:4069401-Ditylum_brightwellii.AAC.1
MNTSAYEATAMAKVPFKTLIKVRKDPNYIELSKLCREVYRFCAAVHSAENGNNGHLGLALPAAQYATQNGGVAYIASPNQPGTYGRTIAANVRCVQQI